MKLDLSNSTTSVFKKNLLAKSLYVFNRGGSRSSKTYSLMQIAYLIATLNNDKTISVVAESLPHLKKGAMKDFFDFLKKYKLYDVNKHNMTDNSYKFDTGSVIEFFGVDSATKVHGAGRDYLFANEIQNLSYETFFQLCMRTSVRVYADYNPVRRFWVDTEYLDNENFKPKCTLIHSTLFDNEFCPKNIKDTIMTRALTDKNYKRVYLDGEIGSVEGLVYQDYTIVPKDIPEEYELIGLGLDWGFTTDPCACVAVYKCQNRLRLKQLVYETGLVNIKLIEKIHNFGIGVNGKYKQLPVIADNSEPKSITDLCNAGINCKKISDKSIVYGIKKVKEFVLEITEDSSDIITEINSYMWDKDSSGKYIEYPVDKNNHACDGTRYLCVELFGKKTSKMSSCLL
jgi:phage terminase large subunit